MRKILTFLLVVFTILACEGQRRSAIGTGVSSVGAKARLPQKVTGGGTIENPNPIMVEGFETHTPADDPGSQPWRLSGGDEYGEISTTTVKTGSRSYFSEIINQAPVVESPRSEIQHKGGGDITPSGVDIGPNQAHLTTRAIGFSFYWPSSNQTDDPTNMTIMQWKALPDGCDVYSTVFDIKLVYDKIEWSLKHGDNASAACDTLLSSAWGTLIQPVVQDVWYDMVVELHYDYNEEGNGYIKIWAKQGGSIDPVADLLLHKTGTSVGKNDAVGPYFKLGLYKSLWNNASDRTASTTAGVTESRMYYDDTFIVDGEWIPGSGGGGGGATPSVYALQEDFTNWTGDNPDGWTISGESGSDPMVTESPTGSMRLFTTGNIVTATFADSLDINTDYNYEIKVDAVDASGLVRVNAFGGTTATIHLSGSTGVLTGTFNSGDNTDVQIKRHTIGSTTDFTIDYLYIWKNSPAQDVLNNLNMTVSGTDQNERDAITWAVDTLFETGEWNRAEAIWWFPTGKSDNVRNWKDGTLGTEVGNTNFVSGVGYTFDPNDPSMLDLNYQPTTDRNENATYIWFGRALSNEVNENYLFGSENSSGEKIGLKYDAINENWVGYIGATGPVGQYITDRDSTSIISIRRFTDGDTTKIYHDNTAVWTKARTFTATPAYDIAIGAIDSVNNVKEGSSSIPKLFAVTDTTSNLATWKAVANGLLARYDTLTFTNDVTNPTAPVIAFNSGTATSLAFDITTASTDVSGIQLYEVYKDNVYQFDISGLATGFTLSALTASTSYDVKIRAQDPSGNFSAYSNILSQSTDAAGTASIVVDFEVDPANPPLRVTGPGTTAERTVADPANASNTVTEHVMEIFDGTTTYDSYTARREYEYKEGIASSPPRYLVRQKEYGFRFKIYLAADHDAVNGGRWTTFWQLHHWAQDPQTSGPPLILRTQDDNADGNFDLQIRYRYTEDLDNNTDVLINTQTTRNVFPKETWCYVVVDVVEDPDESVNSQGLVYVYVSTTGWPTSTDLVDSYDGPLGFNNSSGYTVYPQFGMYWADTRQADRVLDMWNDGTTKQHWYIDEWSYKEDFYLHP